MTKVKVITPWLVEHQVQVAIGPRLSNFLDPHRQVLCLCNNHKTNERLTELRVSCVRVRTQRLLSPQST